MAANKFTPYALDALPVNGIDTNGIYFIKGTSDTTFKIYLRKGDNSDWVKLGTIDSVDRVNNLTGDIKIDLQLSSSGKLSITSTGTGSAVTVTSIDLDARYRKSVDNIPWGEISGAPNFALDNTVVHTSGTETVAGKKTFSSSPKIPTGSANTDAVNKGQMDDADSDLQTQINNLETAVSSALSYEGDIDASSNPNYPAADIGDTYIISKAGKIGGSSGIVVDVGNTIIAKKDTSGGAQGVVGDDWTVLQSDLDQATETKAGFAKIATNAKTDAGNNDETFITPKKLQRKVNSEKTSNNNKYVRYDTSQSLSSSKKTQARSNIEAPKDSDVVHKADAETITGKKTYTKAPKINADATAGDESVRKSQMDSALGNKADDTSVVHKSGTESISGRKTFSTQPRSTKDASNGNDLVRKSQMDSEIAENVAWGDGGKEW